MAGGPRGYGRAVLRPYVDVLRHPGALAFSAAGFVARMPMSMVGLGMVLLISAQTGSYALAGALSAAYAVSASLLSPIGSRIVDRWGQARVLPVLATVSGVALAAFAYAAVSGWGVPALLALAVLSGAFAPNTGALVRARWAAALSGTSQLRTAFALESVLDELIFVTGPPLATLLATSYADWSALAVAAVLLVVGSAALAVQRRTQPLPSRHEHHAGGRLAILLPGIPVVTAVFFLMGGVFGSFEVTTVAFAAETGVASLAGVLLAVYALGSLLGGLVFGVLRLHQPYPRLFWWALCFLAAATVPMPWVRSPWLLGVVALLAGVMVAPVLIIGSTLVEELVPARRLTEAFTWTTTGIGLGLALAASGAGIVIDRVGPSAAYLITVGSAVAALVVAFLTRRRLARARAAAPVDPPVLDPDAPAREDDVRTGPDPVDRRR